MNKASVVIPNLNGLAWLPECLASLDRQTEKDFEIILVDNGSTDGSAAYVREAFPQVRLICFRRNTGFCHAVNAGIRAGKAPYVILLNNDTVCDERFVEELLSGMEQHPDCFSCGAKMLKMDSPALIDDAGDFYNAFGWAFADGKDRPDEGFDRPRRVFSACAGAAIYRKALFEETGLFDERHFAYLEDLDLGYRARVMGYDSWLWPAARVMHAGSASSGSRHNGFKVSHTARNNLWVIRKNMAHWQLLLNLPLLTAGVLVKGVFFTGKGLGRPYLAGIGAGLAGLGACTPVPRRKRKLIRDIRIQAELWKNCLRMCLGTAGGKKRETD